MACIGPQHWLVQPSYPSLKEQLGNALLGGKTLKNLKFSKSIKKLNNKFLKWLREA